MLTEKRCQGPCKQLKQIDQYHWKCKRKGTRQARCKDCMSDYGKKHYIDNSQEYKDRANSRLKELRANNRDLVKSFISSNPCFICNESNIRALVAPVTAAEINNLMTEEISAKLVPEGVKCRNCLASQD